MKAKEGGEAVRVVLNRAAGKFQTYPAVMAAVCFHCYSFAELSITLVSLWVSAGIEVCKRCVTVYFAVMISFGCQVINSTVAVDISSVIRRFPLSGCHSCV